MGAIQTMAYLYFGVWSSGANPWLTSEADDITSVYIVGGSNEPKGRRRLYRRRIAEAITLLDRSVRSSPGGFRSAMYVHASELQVGGIMR